MAASEVVMRTAIRAVTSLPAPIQRLIAGKPIEVDGNELFTEVQTALKILNALPGNAFEDLPLAQARAQIDAEARIFGSNPQVDSVSEIVIPTRAGSAPARVYRHRPTDPLLGSVVYFHGGGWVVGSLDSTEPSAASLRTTSTLPSFRWHTAWRLSTPFLPDSKTLSTPIAGCGSNPNGAASLRWPATARAARSRLSSPMRRETTTRQMRSYSSSL